MQPLEFIKLTPRTNCGECGYAACLAFAAAVTRGGENPRRCPYVDAGGLGEEFTEDGMEAMGLSAVAGLLDEKDKSLVAHLKDKVREVDFSSVASKSGCVWSGPVTDLLRFRYLGQDVTLSRAGVFFDGKKVEEPRDQILLYNYVFYGGGARTGEWVGMESLPNSISKVRTLRVYCEERIAAHFCGKKGLLMESVGRIDGVVEDIEEQSCTISLQVAVLPCLPMMLLFWDEEGDEGFPPRVKVLFDRNVLAVLDLESLVFASERMAERLVELSQ